ncbi:HD-GYP domain-containing protein [Chitinilyticum piscinae]|uniref:HD-GYP domain-containing protein n=1 Tax=Chitinilyticum piscinae TaxID=2866724 RepID=A0A8J7KAF0_9NEIS|nr:HD-GYP domain-containing protein [Chitinilyticum piscinae]MBE9609064.1 HD-GYP domain-containing protein [Chitinilyticum piscinae]
MELRINVTDLAFGLFITELDRPWLDTPFLLQGFLLETQQQLDDLVEYCQQVEVDLDRSTGGFAQWRHLADRYAEGWRELDASKDLQLQRPGLAQKEAQLQAERRERLNILRELRNFFSFWRRRHTSITGSAPPQDEPIILYEDVRSVEQELPEATVIHRSAEEKIEQFADAIRAELQPRTEAIHDVVDSMVDSIVRNPNALLWLTQLRQRDRYSYSHAVDAAVYLLAFGRHLGYPKQDLHNLGLAALMLDIGKLRLPDELLQREGRFSPGEFMLMKTHVQHSLDILNQLEGVHPDVFDTVARHHERHDGSGYPMKLKGEAIGLFGAMAGIVDCFTALISDRAYSSSKSVYEALQLLYKWGERYFHPALVEQFAQCIGIFHVGSLVELSCGDVGIVISQSRTRRLKPKILLILGPDKEPHARPQIIDLMSNPTTVANIPISIRRELPLGSYGIDPSEYFQG